MKTVLKSLILGAFAFSFVACSNNAPQVEQEINVIESENRGLSKSFSFQGQNIDLKVSDIIIVQKAQAKQADDAAAAASMLRNTLAAQGSNTMNDVQLTANAKAEAGMFIFSLDATQTKNVSLQLFDEEGFSLAANNTFSINSGKNYKALNVAALDNGTYKMLLKDEEGKEIVSRVVVENNN